MEGLTEDERKALRGSKFAPLPPKPCSSSSSSSSLPRIAHPGGPVTTNKAVALAKFLERKLQEPGGLDSMKPELIELAVKNAKETVNASETSKQGRIRHVTSFDDDEDCSFLDESTSKPKKKSKKEKKDKKHKKKKNKKMKKVFA
ncbi:nucleolar protein 58 [Amaranthus tricolor]|uniref:nucleolar protein 58 n=1 Tax=Amaranthus tricolor TaxID=29722 RepID=UPI0025901B08|nr:nucleolar protein 58 [Amaranthus tricolor]